MEIVRFHSIGEPNDHMSNWYNSPFTLDGKNYTSVEQYMMEQKALLFGDTVVAAKIMKTVNPKRIKELGREAKGYVEPVWNGMRQIVVYRGVLAKYKQNPELAKLLLATTGIPVECAYNDKVWGIGMGMRDEDAENPELWKGQNLLGFILLQVRNELQAEQRK